MHGAAETTETIASLSAKELAPLREYVNRVGVEEAARALQVSWGVIARALAGLPLRRGSIVLLRTQLTALLAREERT